MAIHFEIGPGNAGVKWFYKSAGEVSGCEVEEFADVTIVLVEGAGLGVRSNNYNVVPMDQLAFIIKGFGDRRIIQFRTISDGQAYIEVVSGTIESNSADPTSVYANFHVKVTKSTAAKPTKVQLNEPHSALNSSASDMIPYRMTYTYTIPYSSNAEEMLAKVDESSRHLAIASHGKPGIIEIGNYFTIRNVEKFEHLRKTSVKAIWLGACACAGNSEGVAFCSSLAQYASSYVVTAGMTVVPSHTLKLGQVEWFENFHPHFFDPSGKLMKPIEFVKLETMLGFKGLKKSI